MKIGQLQSYIRFNIQILHLHSYCFLAEDLGEWEIMSSDVKEFALASFNRVNSLTLNPSCPKASQLKTLLDSRDNRAIIQHFNENQQSEDLADLYHFAVLHLTCNNDSDTLADVLRWGKNSSVHLQWKEEEDILFDDNPIMVASQQESHTFSFTALAPFDFSFRRVPVAPGYCTSTATGSPKCEGRARMKATKSRDGRRL